MIAFIDAHRELYGVEPICRVLPIAPSTYHAHAARRADPPLRRSGASFTPQALGGYNHCRTRRQ